MVKLQSVCIPALTVKVIGPEPLGALGPKGGGGGGAPALQVALANTKPESTISLRVKVPGASALKVVLPVLLVVVTVALMVTELLSTKVKLPLPPTVFLVTTTEPKATLLKLQPLGAPALTVTAQLVGPIALKLALAASLTV